MKVALLMSGYLRSYDINLKFIEDEIINKFEQVDVYLHVTKNESKEERIGQISALSYNKLYQANFAKFKCEFSVA